MSTLAKAEIVNALILFAVLQSDLGSHKKVNWNRLLRPVVLSAVIVPIFIAPRSSNGASTGLLAAGTALGCAGGLAALLLMVVYRSPTTGGTVTSARSGYAALWVVVIGARALFSYGSEHWFTHALGTWLYQHQITPGTVTDALIFMAVAMVVTRTLGLALRARALSTDDEAVR